MDSMQKCHLKVFFFLILALSGCGKNPSQDFELIQANGTEKIIWSIKRDNISCSNSSLTSICKAYIDETIFNLSQSSIDTRFKFFRSKVKVGDDVQVIQKNTFSCLEHEYTMDSTVARDFSGTVIYSYEYSDPSKSAIIPNSLGATEEAYICKSVRGYKPLK
ncbi:MAG: hypothetical protein EBR67_07220 [Proteobacteria bacterium]|jgi:hypothetical protein|nr:hypothetical protein [Pseudomonadota bacterium]